MTTCRLCGADSADDVCVDCRLLGLDVQEEEDDSFSEAWNEYTNQEEE